LIQLIDKNINTKYILMFIYLGGGLSLKLNIKVITENRFLKENISYFCFAYQSPSPPSQSRLLLIYLTNIFCWLKDDLERKTRQDMMNLFFTW